MLIVSFILAAGISGIVGKVRRKSLVRSYLDHARIAQPSEDLRVFLQLFTTSGEEPLLVAAELLQKETLRKRLLQAVEDRLMEPDSWAIRSEETERPDHYRGELFYLESILRRILDTELVMQDENGEYAVNETKARALIDFLEFLKKRGVISSQDRARVTRRFRRIHG